MILCGMEKTIERWVEMSEEQRAWGKEQRAKGKEQGVCLEADFTFFKIRSIARSSLQT